MPRTLIRLGLVVAISVSSAVPAAGQAARPTIEQKTASMLKMDGFLPIYWDSVGGQVFLEIGRLNQELLHLNGLGSGLGSNDIGLDRGQLQGSRIVKFERVGPKVLMVQPNLSFRSSSANPSEQATVRDAFARSVLWGFTVIAESPGRLLVDATEFLVRDGTNMAQRLRPGTYRFEPARSSVYLPMTRAFPKNTELEAELTFASQPGVAGGAGGASQFFEGVSDVSATGEAASFRVHHSFVELPDANYKPRAFDPRAGYGATSWADYSAPVGNQMVMEQRYIRRHRLEKRDPAAAISDPVKPIIYYLDPGVPEPIRTALLDGARWWNQAFEAAGFRNGFQVQIRPDSISPLDIRYNVINWVHRSTRGWSSGASVTDPRTGEILKGVVTLGSLRFRQDYMIAEGLLAPYRSGDERPKEIEDWAMARVRQLSAHEVGHTIGLAHNYYDSRLGFISVLDYPHPVVTLKADGSLDYSQVYENGIAEWDSVAVNWGYRQFAPGTDETAALQKILNDAWDRDIRFFTNQDLGAHPRVNQWSNGTNAAAELSRMMAVRSAALSRFGENVIRRGTPLAQMEEVLVPLYLHHRYQVEATAAVVGGVDFIYALRGDGREAMKPAAAAEQRAALRSLLRTIAPAQLAVPPAVLRTLPPRPMGFGFHRELFPRNTGPAFDAIAPATVAADLTIGFLLDDERAARLVEQKGMDPTLPGLEEVIDSISGAVFGGATRSAYEGEIARATQRVFVDRLISLAGTSGMPQVRAVASWKLERRMALLGGTQVGLSEAERAHRASLGRDIRRFLERPGEVYRAAAVPAPPPGAPIGQPAMNWLEWEKEPE